MSWTAEITNDPTRNFELYVELLNDDHHKARLQRNPAGELEVVFYGGDASVIPWGWLAGIVSRFQEDTGAIAAVRAGDSPPSSGAETGTHTEACGEGPEGKSQR